LMCVPPTSITRMSITQKIRRMSITQASDLQASHFHELPAAGRVIGVSADCAT
jgi:hypothetical protein